MSHRAPECDHTIVHVQIVDFCSHFDRWNEIVDSCLKREFLNFCLENLKLTSANKLIMTGKEKLIVNIARDDQCELKTDFREPR